MEWVEYGALAIAAVLTSKAMDLATAAVKSRLNGNGDHKDDQKNGDSLKGMLMTLQLKLDDQGKDICRLVENIEGNGKPGMKTQIALLNQKVDAHTHDVRLHNVNQ